MEDKNLKEAGKVVLTDEELMEIVGGTGDQDGPLYTKGDRIDVFCRQFETIEECISRPFCQWYDNGYKVCAPHPRANTLLAGKHIR